MLPTSRLSMALYVRLNKSSQEEFQQARETIKPPKDSDVFLWNGAPAMGDLWSKNPSGALVS